MNSNANTALIQAFSLHRTRSGWKSDEEELLWNEVRKAREEGRALKSVFDIVADKTGRKPNSIRNYYYARAKENPEESNRSPAFVPFSDQEIWDLLLNVLSAQAKGISVRACTLSMGSNDTRAMLRYQNKYRSLIKTNPALVRQVMQYMKDNNMSCYDPYDQEYSARKAGRPRKYQASDGSDQLIQGIISLVKLSGDVESALTRIETLEQAVATLEQAQQTL